MLGEAETVVDMSAAVCGLVGSVKNGGRYGLRWPSARQMGRGTIEVEFELSKKSKGTSAMR